MEQFNAYFAQQTDSEFHVDFKKLTLDDLPEGDVTVRVHYSSMNYKDYLATKPNNKIIRSYPMILGIDLAGTVISSDNPSFEKGDKVIATGYDLGVNYFGGYSEVVRLKSEWLIPLPEGLTLEESMILGTAGFTAALSIQLLEDNKIANTNGPVLVRGATGGVGSMATMMLNQIGYKVIASTGQQDQKDYLTSIGADEVIPRISDSQKPLEKTRWQAVVDPVGGETIGDVVKYIQPQGAIALSGNVSGETFSSTVYPFILRGVRLLGVDSAYFPMKRRQHIWRRLATDIKPDQLHDVKTVIPFKDLEKGFEMLHNNQHRGRIIIDMEVE